MSNLIPENILEDILGRVDIVEIISGYISLKKSGSNFKCNCPFHNEKTPSFMVSAERQIYHCFGCGESGNVFKFLMRHERMSFPEAVEMLAKKAGVILPKDDNPKIAEAFSLSSQLYKLNELVVSFYENNLLIPSSVAAMEYFKKRGLSQKSIKEFRIGFAGLAWDNLINFLRSKNVSLGLIEKAGLILAKEGGGYYDRFRNRVIFPIFDNRNRGIGFGGRIMDDSLPKYINSPETPVYVKGKNLFGLNLSKDHIKDLDCAIIVEGYLDLIIPYQEGLKNIVASQGTALTLEQIKLLKRYTNNVVMIYDGDIAGEIATLRSLDMLIEEDLHVLVVPLPKGVDPDTLVRKEGILSLKDKVEHALSLFDYKLKVLKSRHNISEPDGKRKIVSEMLSTINKFKNAILRGEYTKRLAAEIQLPEHYVLEELNKLKPHTLASTLDTQLLKKPNLEINPAEKLLIKFMLDEKELIQRIMQELEPGDFQDVRTAKIVSVMHDLFMQGKSIAASILMNYLSEDDASQLVCESMFIPELSEQEKEKAVTDCIQRIKVQRKKNQREELHLQIKNAQSSGDDEKLGILIQEFHNLIKKGD